MYWRVVEGRVDLPCRIAIFRSIIVDGEVDCDIQQRLFRRWSELISASEKTGPCSEHVTTITLSGSKWEVKMAALQQPY